MRRPMIAGNWKMNTDLETARSLAREIAIGAPQGLDLVVCPPFAWLVPVKEQIAGSPVLLGAQNCWTEPSGAFTGEVAPKMLAELCTYVILGHSERRTLFGESDELVAKKTQAALRAGLQPIVCVGESLATRQSGHAESFVSAQVSAALGALSGIELSRCVVAYEPVWAIGAGISATVIDIQAMTASIRTTLRELAGATADGIRILYGGSVAPGNFAEIHHCQDVDGALAGGASLNAASFLQLAAIAVN